MGSDETVELGMAGETLACEALAARGYAILARRYRTRAGEIDIIARDGETLVFVEVKCRRSDRCGHPAEAVTWRKQLRLVSMARWYLSEYGLHGSLCRFDVVAIRAAPGGAPVIEVIRDAFQVPSP